MHTHAHTLLIALTITTTSCGAIGARIGLNATEHIAEETSTTLTTSTPNAKLYTHHETPTYLGATPYTHTFKTYTPIRSTPWYTGFIIGTSLDAAALGGTLYGLSQSETTPSYALFGVSSALLLSVLISDIAVMSIADPTTPFADPLHLRVQTPDNQWHCTRVYGSQMIDQTTTPIHINPYTLCPPPKTTITP